MITVSILYYVPKNDMYAVYTNHYSCTTLNSLILSRDELFEQQNKLNEPYNIIRIELIYH